MKAHEAVGDALSAGRAKPKGKAKLHEAHVRRAHGGYVVRHNEYRHEDGQVSHDHPMAGSEHVMPNMAGVHKHLDEHMAEKAAAEEKAEGAEEAAGEGSHQ